MIESAERAGLISNRDPILRVTDKGAISLKEPRFFCLRHSVLL